MVQERDSRDALDPPGSGVSRKYYDAAGLRVKTSKANGVVIDHPFPNYEVENPTAATPLRRSSSIE